MSGVYDDYTTSADQQQQLVDEASYLQISPANAQKHKPTARPTLRARQPAGPLPTVPKDPEPDSSDDDDDEDNQLGDEGLYDPRTMLGLSQDAPSDDGDDSSDNEAQLETADALYDPRTLAGLQTAPTAAEKSEPVPPPAPRRRSQDPNSIKRPLPNIPGPRSSKSQPLPPTPGQAAPSSSTSSSRDAELPPPPPARPSLRRKQRSSDQLDPAAKTPGFVGPVNRSQAETILARYPPGAYLVRTSKAVDGYVISVNTTPGRHVHVKATRTQDGGVRTTDQAFANLTALIAFYKDNTIHSGMPLGSPVQTQL